MNWHDLFYIENDVLYNKVDRGGGAAPGGVAGYVNAKGYLQVTVDFKGYYVHRIIYEMRHGKIPDGMQVDHIDHNKTNNADENHRLVTCRQNQMNRPMQKNNTSGSTGVTFDKRRGKWQARININGVNKHLGYFTDIEEAIKSRRDAEEIFGFHKNHGK